MKDKEILILSVKCQNVNHYNEHRFCRTEEENYWRGKEVGVGGKTYTEEKAKVVAVVWGTQFNPFLAVLAILHQNDMKKRTICTRMI